MKSLVKKKNVAIVAISEPFAEESRMSLLGKCLSTNFFYSNEVEGGKLWVLWRDDNAFEVVCKSAQMITRWF